MSLNSKEKRNKLFFEVIIVRKIRLNVILPKNTKKEIRERMLQEEYSLREKSKWICESISELLSLEDYPQYVKTAGLMSNLADVETIYITEDLDQQLDDAILAVRKEYLELDGIKSLIVRASIVRRLWHPAKAKKE